MQAVERHIISLVNNNENSKNIDKLSFYSKNLYNYANYTIRQAFTKNPENIPEFSDLINKKNFISEYELTTRLAKIDQIDYRNLPAKVSQNIIGLLYQNWRTFFITIKDYVKNPTKYKGRPGLPKYKNKKNGRNILVFNDQCCVLKENIISFPKICKIEPIKTEVDNFCQVRIVPQSNCYVIEVVYNKKEVLNENLNKDNYISIDLGVNNVCAVTSNQHGFIPFLINGKPLKSYNQYYNKQKAKLQSLLQENHYHSKNIARLTFKRNNKIEDSIHKISKYIVDFCVKNNVGNIVIGYNNDWKNECNMGKKNNQTFVQIPHKKLIDKITYKANLVGINVILVKESHTSKCDALALETIEHHDKYLGKRTKRGYFKSSTEKYINADINGSLNILRKVIGNDFIQGLADRGVGLTPYRINIY